MQLQLGACVLNTAWAWIPLGGAERCQGPFVALLLAWLTSESPWQMLSVTPVRVRDILESQIRVSLSLHSRCHKSIISLFTGDSYALLSCALTSALSITLFCAPTSGALNTDVTTQTALLKHVPSPVISHKSSLKSFASLSAP